MKYKVIIPASGTGNRFGGKTPKQFIRLGPSKREVLAYSINKFHSLKEIDEIIIATRKDYIPKVKEILRKNKFHKVRRVVQGGKTRQASVYNALKDLNCKKGDFVLVHDAVRPFISRKKIKEMLKETKHHYSVIPGLKVNDTMKTISKNKYVVNTVSRDNLWRIQTPQVFRYDILMKSYRNALKDKFIGTDEASLLEHSNMRVKIVEGEVTNIKITTKSDIKVVDFNKLLK